MANFRNLVPGRLCWHLWRTCLLGIPWYGSNGRLLLLEQLLRFELSATPGRPSCKAKQWQGECLRQVQFAQHPCFFLHMQSSLLCNTYQQNQAFEYVCMSMYDVV